MRCGECNGEYVEITGNIELNSHIIGKYIVPDAHHLLCQNCGNILLTGETWKIADAFLKSAIKGTLEGFPIKEFMSAADTAEYLGITKQALHKNKRISNGFIFSVTHGGRTEYLKKSVELFKEFGDGRFPLHDGQREDGTVIWYRVYKGGKRKKAVSDVQFGKLKSSDIDCLIAAADTHDIQGLG